MVQRIEAPVVVMPPPYELPLNLRRWCKLGEVIAVAENVAKLSGADFPATIPQLIRRFALLTSPNDTVGSKRIFLYCNDYWTMEGKEIPDGLPSTEFELPVDENTFVPEEWVRDTLRMIRKGCFETRYYQDTEVIGIRKSEEGNYYIERL